MHNPHSQPRDANKQIHEFMQRRQALIQIQTQLLAILEQLKLTTLAEKVRADIKRTKADEFNVMVIGEFSRGKSTLLNAILIGSPKITPAQRGGVLPMHATPTTAIITLIQYHDQPGVILYPKDQHQPPIRATIDQIEKYTAVDPDHPDDPSPFAKAEVFWPHDLLENNVRLIDSPGLNAVAAHEEITTKFMEQADAILFVTRCTVAGEITEMTMIQTLKSMGHEDILFVCNGINEIADHKEQERLKKHLNEMFAPETKQGVFFVNALGAFQARQRGDQIGLEATNIPALENALQYFLATERARIKIVHPAQQIRLKINDVRKALHDRERQLAETTAELIKRKDAAESDFQRLKDQANTIASLINTMRFELNDWVGKMTELEFRQIVKEIPGWANAHKQTTTIGAFSTFRPQLRDRAVKEIEEALRQRMTMEIDRWKLEELAVGIEGRLTTLNNDLQRRIDAFDAELQAIRQHLSASTVLANGTSIEAVGKLPDDAPLWQRITTTVAGVLMMDPGLAIAGASGGMKRFAQQFGVSIGIAAVALLTGAIWIYLPAAILMAVINLIRTSNSVNEQLKQKVGEAFAKTIQDNVPTYRDKIVSAVDGKIASMRDLIVSELNQQIASVQEQLMETIRIKEQGKAAEERERQQIGQVRQQLDGLDNMAYQLIVSYALNK